MTSWKACPAPIAVRLGLGRYPSSPLPPVAAHRSVPNPCYSSAHGHTRMAKVFWLHKGVRLVFQPADDPVPTRDDGSLDWTRVKRIRLLEVKDYHDE